MFEFLKTFTTKKSEPKKSSDITKVYNFDDIGKAVFCKTKRAKKLKISIKSHEEIRVTIPYSCTFKMADDFLNENTNWIIEKQQGLKARHSSELFDDKYIKQLRKEAKIFLPKRTEELAEIYNFQYKKVYIKNQKTRWGSCSHVNNINLNINLMRLPKHLIDYVILHELMHTRHKNHGPKFWYDLNQLVPDVSTYRYELRKYNLV